MVIDSCLFSPLISLPSVNTSKVGRFGRSDAVKIGYQIQIWCNFDISCIMSSLFCGAKFLLHVLLANFTYFLWKCIESITFDCFIFGIRLVRRFLISNLKWSHYLYKVLLLGFGLLFRIYLLGDPKFKIVILYPLSTCLIQIFLIRGWFLWIHLHFPIHIA